MACPEKFRLFDQFIALATEQRAAAARLRVVAQPQTDRVMNGLHLGLLKAEFAWNEVERHRTEHGC